MGKKHKSGNDPINDFIDWQNKQFTPWEYFSEGKLLPYIKADGNPKRAAILWFALSILSGFVGTVIIVGINTTYSSTARFNNGVPYKVYERYIFDFSFSKSWWIILIFVVYTLFCVLMGIRYCQRHKKAKSKRKERPKGRKKRH